MFGKKKDKKPQETEEQKHDLGLNNMNGMTHQNQVCDINNMNCLNVDDTETAHINDLNKKSSDESVVCSLNDMNCRGENK